MNLQRKRLAKTVRTAHIFVVLITDCFSRFQLNDFFITNSNFGVKDEERLEVIKCYESNRLGVLCKNSYSKTFWKIHTKAPFLVYLQVLKPASLL